MRIEATTAKNAVNEHEVAVALNLSVHTLRRDRVGARRIPFFRVGRCVRYDLGRVWEALAAIEVGGPTPRPARRRG